MNTIKKIGCFLAFTFSTVSLFAQEYPVNNQYYFNYYLVNPAVAGAAKCHYFMLTHKQQWMGIDDAPYTTSLSYQGRWRNSVGVGAYLYNDK
ncbi:MAG: type IX secretion system membrane protein PorP/SprF, partial [Paludibacteraceae bacterium]|nr:type IX secretion system membrane protein PorP/SprF [Paludibacteraceae bacterium]